MLAGRVGWVVVGRLFGLAALLGACEEPADDPLVLPEIVAASKYIDFSTYADTTALCMDDLLAREDRLVEAVAAYLGVGPPTGRIHHVQVAPGGFLDPDSWACDDAMACYQYHADEDVGVIRTTAVYHPHELVHAVDIPTLGVAHRTLVEGLADYLGSASTSEPVLADFPARFKAMISASSMPDDYRVAMHFVGSMLARDGVDAYRRLRAEMPLDADLERFAAVFAAVHGVSLDAALAEMREKPVRGLYVPDGCDGGDELEHIAWTGDVAEATLGGTCGDAAFHGAGNGFARWYTIDVPRAGIYRLSVAGPAGVEFDVDLRTCPDDGGYGGHGGDGWYEFDVASPGRHRVGAWFAEADVQVQFKLELVEASPP